MISCWMPPSAFWAVLFSSQFMSGFICRAMQGQDLAEVIRIQAEAYVDEILETDEVIRARFAHTADTSWVIERAGEVCGYLVGYYAKLGEVSPWGCEFVHKRGADALYLHDLAISRSASGQGLGPLIVEHALTQAQQQQCLQHAVLVSVQNSKHFWEKLGFIAVQNLMQTQQQQLATYAGPAFYMAKPLLT